MYGKYTAGYNINIIQSNLIKDLKAIYFDG